MTDGKSQLIYGVDDKLPFFPLLLMSIQHIFLMTSSLAFPVVLVGEIGGDALLIRSVVALTMIACGIGTILQAMRWGVVGSGYLCPNLCGPNFFAASMSAAWLGGLPLMRGMIMIAGLFEIVLARLIKPLRFLFPAEITGLVVFMVAEGIIPLGVSKFVGVNFEGEPIQGRVVLVSTITLLTMAGINIFIRNRLKLYSVLIGMTVGYILSFALGVASLDHLRTVVLQAPWFALPAFSGFFDLSFRWSMLPLFLVVSTTGALKTFGNLIMCEKVNNPNWKEPDIGRISRGLIADALCVTVSGLAGGLASDTSASNVAFSRASGATSRWIGMGAGVLFILLGFSPKISGLLSIMPTPVMGAILLFVICYMLTSGLQIMLSAGMDEPRIFALAIALIFGLSLDALPALFVGIPPWLRPLFESSLTLTTVLAVILNQCFRWGRVTPKPEAASEKKV